MPSKPVNASREGVVYMINEAAVGLSEKLGGREVVVLCKPYHDDPSVAIGNSGTVTIQDGMTMVLLGATALLHGMRTKQQSGSLSLSEASLDDLADFIRDGMEFIKGDEE